MTPFREMRIDAFGLSLAARLWHEEVSHPVIALHGWLDNCASFDVLAPAMPAVTLLAIDLAGHGLSDHRSADASDNLWDDLKEILAVANAMGWQQFSLLGHSRGGIVAMMLASLYPERVGRLGLIEGLWPPTREPRDAPGQLRKAIDAAFNPPADTVYTSVDEMIAMRTRGPMALSLPAARQLVERNVVPVDGGWRWNTDPRLRQPSPMMLSDAHVDAFISRLQQPAMLALGERGIPSFFAGWQERLARYPFIDHAVYPGGHHLHMEDSVDVLAGKFGSFFGGDPTCAG